MPDILIADILHPDILIFWSPSVILEIPLAKVRLVG